MEKNIGKIDRILRTILGLILIGVGWGLLKNNWLGLILNLFAALMLFEALVGKCWLYKKLNFSTNRSAQKPPSFQPPTL